MIARRAEEESKKSGEQARRRPSTSQVSLPAPNRRHRVHMIVGASVRFVRGPAGTGCRAEIENRHQHHPINRNETPNPRISVPKTARNRAASMGVVPPRNRSDEGNTAPARGARPERPLQPFRSADPPSSSVSGPAPTETDHVVESQGRRGTRRGRRACKEARLRSGRRDQYVGRIGGAPNDGGGVGGQRGRGWSGVARPSSLVRISVA